MSAMKGKIAKPSRQNKILRWMLINPAEFAQVLMMTLVVVGGSAMYYAQYTRDPGEPSLVNNKCSMWNRC